MENNSFFPNSASQDTLMAEILEHDSPTNNPSRDILSMEETSQDSVTNVDEVTNIVCQESGSCGTNQNQHSAQSHQLLAQPAGTSVLQPNDSAQPCSDSQLAQISVQGSLPEVADSVIDVNDLTGTEDEDVCGGRDMSAYSENMFSPPSAHTYQSSNDAMAGQSSTGLFSVPQSNLFDSDHPAVFTASDTVCELSLDEPDRLRKLHTDAADDKSLVQSAQALNKQASPMKHGGTKFSNGDVTRISDTAHRLPKSVSVKP